LVAAPIAADCEDDVPLAVHCEDTRTLAGLSCTPKMAAVLQDDVEDAIDVAHGPRI
jgi:hypothetical protein